MSRPDDARPTPRRFFLAGASKCGTTALYHFLGQHPEIFLCPIKEPSYFAARDFLALEEGRIQETIGARVRNLERWHARKLPRVPKDGFAFEWSTYEALFEAVRDEPVVGEGSTTYWYAPNAPRAISDRFPDAHFVLVLRNPAERFFSHYLTTRWNMPLVSCAELFEMTLERRDGWGLVLEMGRYATNLRRFLEFFPRSRISVHLYEDLCSDPARVGREIFGFLGVDSSFSVDTSRRINEPVLPRVAALHALYRSSAVLQWAASRLPQRLREHLRPLYRKPRSHAVMHEADRRMINTFYRDEISETAQLIGRDLSAWLA